MITDNTKFTDLSNDTLKNEILEPIICKDVDYFTDNTKFTDLSNDTLKNEILDLIICKDVDYELFSRKELLGTLYGETVFDEADEDQFNDRMDLLLKELLEEDKIEQLTVTLSSTRKDVILYFPKDSQYYLLNNENLS